MGASFDCDEFEDQVTTTGLVATGAASMPDAFAALIQ
jgi:hypothetical protein